MVSPGLLSAGPIRLVMDMIHAAQGTVTVSDVLSGLLSRPGGDGPALTADMVAAIVISEATMFAGGGPNVAAGRGDSLRSQVRWVGRGALPRLVEGHVLGCLGFNVSHPSFRRPKCNILHVEVYQKALVKFDVGKGRAWKHREAGGRGKWPGLFTGR